MNTIDWTTITAKLHEAGFKVSYSRVSYAPNNPLWRAKAQREGKDWSAFGRDLEAALVELEKQTHELTHDWRQMKKVA